MIAIQRPYSDGLSKDGRPLLRYGIIFQNGFQWVSYAGSKDQPDMGVRKSRNQRDSGPLQTHPNGRVRPTTTCSKNLLCSTYLTYN